MRNPETSNTGVSKGWKKMGGKGWQQNPVSAEAAVATGLLSRAVVVEPLSCYQRFNTDAGRKWGTNGLFSFSSYLDPPGGCLLLTDWIQNPEGAKPWWCSPRQWGPFGHEAGWIEGETMAPARRLPQCASTPGHLVFPGTWQEGWSDVTQGCSCISIFERYSKHEIGRICSQIDYNSEFQSRKCSLLTGCFASKFPKAFRFWKWA